MTRHRILIALVALLAVGVVAAVIYLETSSNSAADPVPATTSTLTPPTLESTLPPTTPVSTTTEVPASLPPTTLAPTSLAPTTLAPATLAPTTQAPTTLPPTTLPPATLPPPERALVPVVVSSGPSNGDRLRPGALLLGAVGWTDIRALNGSVALTETTVFYVDGLQAAAGLLAADASLPATAIAPMSEAPPVAGLANAQLLFYFGGA